MSAPTPSEKNWGFHGGEKCDTCGGDIYEVVPGVWAHYVTPTFSHVPVPHSRYAKPKANGGWREEFPYEGA